MTMSIQTVDRNGTGSVKWDIQRFRYHAEGLTPFWIADMDFAVADCVTEALSRRVGHPVFGYTALPSGYNQSICGWFQRRHGIAVYPEWVLPAQHAVTVLAVVLRALTKPGDVCMTLTPVYDAFFSTVRGAKRELLELKMDEADGRYRLDFEAFEAMLSRNVKCLIFCNPHNPGGKVWTQAELMKIADLCDRYGVYIISDDVHCDWVFEPRRYTSLLTVEKARTRTVVITSPGKTFNLAGLCVSNLLIADAALKRRIESEFAAMFIKGPNLLGAIGTNAAYGGGDEWFDAVKKTTHGNILRAARCIAEEMPLIRCYENEGTFLMWLDVRGLDGDSAHVTDVLARRYGISVSSGAAYAGNGFIRINAATSRENMEVLLMALKNWHEDCRKDKEKKQC